MRLRIQHKTVYLYWRPVALHRHRLMLSPREGPVVQVIANHLSVAPEGTIRWSVDVSGNTVATVAFSGETDRLTIDSTVEVALSAEPFPVIDIGLAVQTYPFCYSSDDVTDLGALLVPQYEDRQGRLRAWAQDFVAAKVTDTLSLLKDLNNGLRRRISYQSRDAEGTQGPLDTLDRGWGTCRDFAVLFADAARALGFGVRLVSGYLYDTTRSGQGGGSTHAWNEVYLPDAGWIAFDPTHGTMGGHGLVPVAVGRHIGQIMPVSGNFQGPGNAFREMIVDVDVARTDA